MGHISWHFTQTLLQAGADNNCFKKIEIQIVIVVFEFSMKKMPLNKYIQAYYWVSGSWDIPKDFEKSA